MATTTTLTDDTPATQIHGQTGQEIVTCIIPAGTVYTYEGPGRPGWAGDETADILVEGYRYRVLAQDLARQPPTRERRPGRACPADAHPL